MSGVGQFYFAASLVEVGQDSTGIDTCTGSGKTGKGWSKRIQVQLIRGRAGFAFIWLWLLMIADYTYR